MTAWFKALKEWNKNNEKFEIPKKGSKAYAEVKELSKKYSDMKGGKRTSHKKSHKRSHKRSHKH